MKVVVNLYQLTTSTDHALKSAEIHKILKEIDAVTEQSIAEVRVIYVLLQQQTLGVTLFRLYPEKRTRQVSLEASWSARN
jgi:hypothetical protein